MTLKYTTDQDQQKGFSLVPDPPPLLRHRQETSRLQATTSGGTRTKTHTRSISGLLGASDTRGPCVWALEHLLTLAQKTSDVSGRRSARSNSKTAQAGPLPYFQMPNLTQDASNLSNLNCIQRTQAARPGKCRSQFSSFCSM